MLYQNTNNEEKKIMYDYQKEYITGLGLSKLSCNHVREYVFLHGFKQIMNVLLLVINCIINYIILIMD